jgi:hypothetical protein
MAGSNREGAAGAIKSQTPPLVAPAIRPTRVPQAKASRTENRDARKAETGEAPFSSGAGKTSGSPLQSGNGDIKQLAVIQDQPRPHATTHNIETQWDPLRLEGQISGVFS